MADHTEAARASSEATAYVGEMAGELALVARRHGLDALGYLLEMARLEAENATRGGTSGDGKSKTVHG